MKHSAAKFALSKILHLPPDDPPLGEVPAAVQPGELEYTTQLCHVYGEAEGSLFSTPIEVQAHPVHGDHFRDQRTRFFAAAWFERNYRDSTAPASFLSSREEVYHGAVEVHRRTHPTHLARVDAVMQQASASAALFEGSQTRVYVRQGGWHQFVNEGRIRWHR